MNPHKTLRVSSEFTFILQVTKQTMKSLLKVTGLGSNPDLLNSKGRLLFTLHHGSDQGQGPTVRISAL